MTAKRTFDAASLDRADRSKLLTGLVVPRPIGWIGTRGPAGDNVAPFSFYNLVVTTPPTLLFCPGSSQRSKDSLVNARDSGVFTVSVVTADLVEAMNQTSAEHPPEVDEFEATGLTKAEGSMVDAPMVAEAKANLECTVTAIHHVGPGPAGAVVFGEVVAIHVAEDLLDGTRILFDRLDVVGRLAGGWYSHTRDLFRLERPDP